MRLPRLSRTTDWSGSVTRSGSPLFASSAITEFLLAANHAAHKAKSASIAAAQYTRGRILPKGFRGFIFPPANPGGQKGKTANIPPPQKTGGGVSPKGFGGVFSPPPPPLSLSLYPY